MDKKSEPKRKEAEIAERTSPPGDIVYEAIYREGEHELSRGGSALAFSGLAAGLSMGFSFVSEALLRTHLPSSTWAPLVTKLGYAVGFLIVILGRQQLFTKNTLTVILPLLKTKKPKVLAKVIWLWTIVLVANLAGALVFAWLLARTSLFDAPIHESFSVIATETIRPGFATILLRGILAGWLIALMVWLLPFAEAARLWVIVIVSYLVGLAGLPHVVAGTIEALYLVSTGVLTWAKCLGAYLLPTLIGNTIGGVALVAFGAHVEFIEAKK
jgi:formate/nitrite transporter FocA (FNT family)